MLRPAFTYLTLILIGRAFDPRTWKSRWNFRAIIPQTWWIIQLVIIYLIVLMKRNPKRNFIRLYNEVLYCFLVCVHPPTILLKVSYLTHWILAISILSRFTTIFFLWIDVFVVLYLDSLAEFLKLLSMNSAVLSKRIKVLCRNLLLLVVLSSILLEWCPKLHLIIISAKRSIRHVIHKVVQIKLFVISLQWLFRWNLWSGR